MNPTPHGKIFRLPHHIREQIHIRRLRDAPDDARHWKLLRALCRDVASLRRGDHSAQWLVLQRLQLGGPLPSLPFPKANDAPGKSR